MKWSYYIFYYKSKSGVHILYNYSNDTMIFLEDELYTILDKYKNNVSDLSSIHPDFYQELVKKQFIVNIGFDEKQEVIKRITKHLENKDIFKLTINPTLDCNLKCWYCYENHIKGSVLRDSTLMGLKRIIAKKANDKNTRAIYLSFFGGEPLLRSKHKILSIIEFAKKNIVNNKKELKVHFTTNAVLLNKNFIQDLTKITHNVEIQVPFDGDKEKHNSIKKFTNGKGSYDIVFANLKTALQAGVKANIRCNYTKYNISSFKNFIEDVNNKLGEYNNLITFQMQQIWQTETESQGDLPEKLLEIKNYIKIEKNNSNLNGEGAVSSYCYADYSNSIVVNYNGDVFKCTARDFTRENRVGLLKEDGSISYEKSYSERLEYRFNRECLSCSILPICTICSQKRFEFKNKDKCPVKISEEDKRGQIKYRLEALISQYL